LKKAVLGILAPAFLIASLISIAGGMQSVSLSDRPSGIKLMEQDQTGLTFELNLGRIDFYPVGTSEGLFVMARINGLARSLKVGEPCLPVANKLFSIPFDAELATTMIDYEIQELSLTDLGITDPILPVQPPLSKSDDPAAVPFQYRRDIYAAGGYYALPLVNTEILGIMRDVYLARVSISPVEYNPAENTVRIYKNITFRVNYEHPDWQKTKSMRSRYYSPFFEPVYHQIANYHDQTVRAGGDSTDLVQYPVKYLIVSDRMFESQLQPFIEWKTKKGFNVITAYTDSIGYLNTEIKSFIEGLYNAGTVEDPAPSFVLLVGDAQQIPPFDGTTEWHITDRDFCEFTGDDFPEIYYGRFSAQDSAQLQPQIDKTLEYEQYLMPDPGYLAEITLVSGVDDTYAATYGNGALNYGTNLYFNVAHGISPHIWLYPASGQAGAAFAIVQTINDGIGFYNYTAHCSHEGPNNPSLKTWDISGLTNYHRYLLGIGNCCLSNTFGTDYATPCFGEVFLQAEDKGGIGYIGGSNSTYWDEDYWWAVGAGPIDSLGPEYEETTMGAYDGLFHDHGEPVNKHFVTNAAIVFAGNLGVTAAGSQVAYYWEIYHLMGDPSVSTYLGLPSQNNVIHDESIVMGATSCNVYADPGSYVGISFKGVVHGAAYIDSSGYANVALAAFTEPGTADIVVTAQNRIPYVSNILVESSDGPFVIYSDNTINDIAGNNDDMVNCGEMIGLGIWLVNVGKDSAFNVEAVLTTGDTCVTVTDSTELYGDIEGDMGTAYVADAFTFQVSGSTPDGHTIPFQMVVTSAGRDTTWISNFGIPVHSPAMNFVAISVNDAAGNQNGNLDPGETTELIITLENTGSADALSIDAVLSENDPFLTVIDDNGYFGDIYAGGGTGDNGPDVFSVSADDTCALGHPVTFQLDLSGTGGYSGIVTFEFVVGDRATFFYDDFSLDRGWTGFGGSGEWTSSPAVGGLGSDYSGGPDPDEDHSPSFDNYVLGNDLIPDTGGDYNQLLNSAQWITSPILDCTDFTGIQLKFYRRLGVESNSFDHAYLQAYDGLSWVTLFANGPITTDEMFWNDQTLDVSSYADGNPAFQIRFGIGPTDRYVQFCGWNIDDLELKGYGWLLSGYPVISHEPEILSVSLPQDQSIIDTVTIHNDGDTLLKIRFSSSASWLTCSFAPYEINAGNSFIMPVTINAAQLPEGEYEGALCITTSDPVWPYRTIPVLASVGPALPCGDADGDGGVNMLDILHLISYLYKGGAPPAGPADINSDEAVNMLDILHMIAYLYKGGPDPTCP
jgi:hypothetical protein